MGLGAAVTVVHDNSTQYAYMDNNTQVISAGAINIKASANQTLTTTTGEAAVGLGAVGAAFTKATFDGSTHAYVGDGVSIGQTAGQTVGSLSVNASNTTDLTTHTVALTGGFIGASGNFSFIYDNPTVEAHVGGGNIAVTGAIGVSAVATPKTDATAFGVAVGAAGGWAFRTPDRQLTRPSRHTWAELVPSSAPIPSL